MFSYVTLEQRVPQDNPLREIRRLTDVVLGSLSAAFDELYSASGRPSIAPEYVLRALLLQAFYSVRSERQLVEQLDYNLLFRWFVGLGMDDAVWNHAVFSKNRSRHALRSRGWTARCGCRCRSRSAGPCVRPTRGQSTARPPQEPRTHPHPASDETADRPQPKAADRPESCARHSRCERHISPRRTHPATRAHAGPHLRGTATSTAARTTTPPPSHRTDTPCEPCPSLHAEQKTNSSKESKQVRSP